MLGRSAAATSAEEEVLNMETGTVISIGALIVAFIGLVLNSRKETRSDAAAMAEIKTALNTANVGISDIRVDLRSMRESISDHSERLARVEARSEDNSRRISALEG